jgi:argininosuccinate lyase
VEHTHEGSIGNLCNKEIAALMEETIAGFRFERAEMALQELVK